MAGIDQLVDELERSYLEAQERMSDPAVYNDHREAAEVGRRLKELEGPLQARAGVARRSAPTSMTPAATATSASSSPTSSARPTSSRRS